MHLIFAYVVFCFLLSAFVLAVGHRYFFRRERERQAWREQMIDAKKRTDAESVQFSKDCQAREEARQRKMVEHLARYGTTGYN